ncbi:MAG: mechanosensitive ion channel [Kosmotoga sp.]|uniref:mechanosensitive ion channel family protein n=1 Tax=Kosmotoga sp. TaxID=1955248 RepID=UPI001DAC2ABE|nr:mechanosensitive ion channel domain-containing protein [Kosmotoga sp.]MBO8165906.1 mechanosensitive ion channel [Kosmotoga sp.]
MTGWVSVLSKIGISLLLLLVAYYSSKFVFKVIRGFYSRKGATLKAPNTVKLVLNVFFFLIAAMIILSVVFEDLIPVITGIGVGGLVIGIALQKPLENVISGIFLLVGRVVIEGDVVKIGEHSGVVDTVNLNHTILRTFDGKKVLIPNTSVWSGDIIHYWPGPVRRLEMIVGLPYEVDVSIALGILQEVIDEEELIYRGEGVSNFVVFNGFNASSIDFKLYFWFERANYFDVQNNVATGIYKKLKEKGINIPFPQLDIHVKELPGAGVIQ